MSAGATVGAVAFEGVSPIFTVKDIRASLAYYVNVLGFKLDWGGETAFASISRGNCHIMLCEGDQGHAGAWVWVGVGDTEILHDEYRAKGARIRHRPTNYEWAYEMQVEDPDGNILRMGSEPRKGEPVGAWLDMHGISWVRSADGKWKRAINSQ
jgi:catechol 2,3-dioxygenase-like lactoylglutathione lyase family enzyme